MTKDEALRLALEALEESHPEAYRHIITAIRECLAKPEHDWKAEYIKQVELHNQTLDELRDALAQQEPVIDKSAAVRIATALGWEPKRKPLTDEEIDKLPWGPHEGNPMTFAEGLREFARAIEAKLKEKNT